MNNHPIPSGCMRGIWSGPRPPDRDKAGGGAPRSAPPGFGTPSPRAGDMKPNHGMGDDPHIDHASFIPSQTHMSGS